MTNEVNAYDLMFEYFFCFQGGLIIMVRSITYPVVTIITVVYNSKEYIHECAESVLNQSIIDFEWLVLDNGCIDGTSEILKEYAKKDKRVKLFISEENSIICKKPIHPDFEDYMYNSQSEYICHIDSDDIFHKDFIKDLYGMAKKYDSDIAVGGTEMFKEENPRLRGERIPPSFRTDTIEKLGDVFHLVYGCFRPIWGKIIRTQIYIESIKIYRNYIPKLLNANDTLINIIFLKKAKSVVCIDKVLHYYRIRQKSHYSSHPDKDRYLDYLIIYEESKKLLESWNKLSKDNEVFIKSVLYNSMKDIISMTGNANNMAIEDKIEVINTIISDYNIRKITNEVGLFIKLLDDATRAIDLIIEDERKNSVAKYQVEDVK